MFFSFQGQRLLESHSITEEQYMKWARAEFRRRTVLSTIVIVFIIAALLILATNSALNKQPVSLSLRMTILLSELGFFLYIALFYFFKENPAFTRRLPILDLLFILPIRILIFGPLSFFFRPDAEVKQTATQEAMKLNGLLYFTSDKYLKKLSKEEWQKIRTYKTES